MVQMVEVGYLFRDNDKRLKGSRIVRVLSIEMEGNTAYAVVENVEHWDEKQIGRRTYIRLDRLKFGAGRQTGYTKVSH
jgi:hypothetical protein